MNFTSLELNTKLIDALHLLKIEEPTTIQQKAIPIVLAGKDLIAQAHTGSGKTFAYLLPIITILLREEVAPNKRPLHSLIIAPTRELVTQIAMALESLIGTFDIKHAAVFGGANIEPQKKILEKGVEILVATPGRLMELVSKKHLFLSKVKILVIDEADRMLDMGFISDINTITTELSQAHQTLMFSATFTKSVRKLAFETMKEPLVIETKMATPPAHIEQKLFFVEKEQKGAAISYYIGSQNIQHALVFVNTKEKVQELSKELTLNGLKNETLYGDKTQHARQKALTAFKEQKVRVLIATDIAARGIDIVGLESVINYEIPNLPEDYSHRIGRTGRAGEKGLAVSFISKDQLPALHKLESTLQLKLDDATLEGFEAPFNRKTHFVPKMKKSVKIAKAKAKAKVEQKALKKKKKYTTKRG